MSLKKLQPSDVTPFSDMSEYLVGAIVVQIAVSAPGRYLKRRKPFEITKRDAPVSAAIAAHSEP